MTTAPRPENRPNPVFLPHHEEYLKARAVPAVLAELAGMKSVNGQQAAALLGRRSPVESDGLAIPYDGLVAPYHRVRVDKPDAVRGARYLAPAGVDVPVYVPPGRVRAAAPTPPVGLEKVLVVVESPVKALAVLATGVDAVGLGGTATTLEPEKHGIRRVNGSWNRVALEGRTVIVCFDAGRATNPNVARDEARLVNALSAEGADVRVAGVPLAAGGKDRGPDDFIAAAGATAIHKILSEALPGDLLDRINHHVGGGRNPHDLLDDAPFLHGVLEASPGVAAKARQTLHAAGVGKSVLNDALKKIEERAADAAADLEDEVSELGDHLKIVQGRFCKAVGPPVALCNFDARILEERIVDDGAERRRSLVIAGTLDTGAALPRVTLEPDDLADPLWAMKAWGAGAKVASRGGVVDDIRLAMQIFSQPEVHIAYSHTGWRPMGDATGNESGLPVFLTANGAIGASGVSVQLEDRLALYSLPPEPMDPAEAVRASLRLLELGPPELMLTLLALTYRAPLQSLFPADFALFVVGKTGSLKTSVSKLATAHFGASLADTPVTSFEASVASIEMVLHRLKDVLALVDDFKPASTHPKDAHQSKAREVFSAVGNQEGRGRQGPTGPCGPRAPRGHS